jgi:hypothetical protein
VRDKARWAVVLALCVVAAGLRSIGLRKDANWDLKNYHWYNPWALLNDRMGFDVVPAQLQSFHNPLGDLFLYGLVHAIANPRTVAFLMAVPVAIAAFFLVRILVMLFPVDRDRANGILWIAAALVIGFTGVGGTAAWGSSFNEWPSIALVMCALWLTMRAAMEGEERHRRAVPVAGFLVGCAVALKLTFGVYALGYFVACMAWGTLRERGRRALVAGVFMGLGFALAYGWWGWILWREFANPFFPYFNALFKSPWWEPISWFDPHFGPRNWHQWVFFPIYFAREHLLVAEVSFRDWRFATLYVLALMCWIASRWRNLRENPNAPAPQPRPSAAAWRLLVLFTLVSYLAWLRIFGIYRYLAALEAVSGLLIVGAVLYLAPRGRVRIAVVVVLTGLLIGTTRLGDLWGRVDFGKTYFDVAPPDIPPGSLVIMGYVQPLAYAAPFFRPETRFVSPTNNLIQLGQHNKLARRAEDLIRRHEGPLYLLQHERLEAQDPVTLRYFGLTLDRPACVPVPSSFDANLMRLCPLKRDSSPAAAR